MDLEKIAGLIKLVEDSSLTEFTYKDVAVEITMSKLDNPPVVAASAPAPVPFAAPAPLPAAPAAPAAPAGAAEELFIESPIIGTFYAAPAPGAPAFVKVGQTVCILEAMKLMNEIAADWDCEIEEVLVSNEQKVEYGQPLFRVKRL